MAYKGKNSQEDPGAYIVVEGPTEAENPPSFIPTELGYCPYHHLEEPRVGLYGVHASEKGEVEREIFWYDCGTIATFEDERYKILSSPH